jgi:hypothetical protein
MKKYILALAIAALASVALATTASADVPRYQSQTATFTVNQPKDIVGQFGNVWRHEFKVAVNPCDNTFSGTAPTYDNGASSPTWTENVTGSFGDNTVSFDTDPIGGGSTFKVTNAPYGTEVPVVTNWTANEVTMIASAPTFNTTSNYKNHGDYVKAQPDKNDAAHSCIGMPIPAGR